MSILAAGIGSVFVWKLLALFAAYFAGLVLAIFLHELGHAVVALVATKQRVLLQIGRSQNVRAALGRLDFSFGVKGLRYGFTKYDRSVESRGRQIFVAIAGPLASLLACLSFALLAMTAPVGGWALVVWLGLFVANFRILIVSIWPIALRPDGPDGEVWLSDALDIWRMLRN